MIELSAGALLRVLSLSALALTWCGGHARAQGSDALYEKAKLEKSLTLYAAGPSEPYQRWSEEFQKRYPGVTVAFTGGLSVGLNKKIDE
jgi:ABC-type phosphate transport system substrate-binding protein